jgi:hypothetical protein
MPVGSSLRPSGAARAVEPMAQLLMAALLALSKRLRRDKPARVTAS